MAVLAVGMGLPVPVTASALAPLNDDFDNATAIDASGDAVPGSTDGATAELGEPNHGGDSAGTSVWYRWRAERSGLIKLRCDSGFETIVAVYRGTSVGALAEVGTDHNGAQCDPPDLYFRASAGVEYRIAVDAATGGGSGAFTIYLTNTSPVPANDDFADRAPVRFVGPGPLTTGTTEGSGREPEEPAHGGSSIGSSVWFTWTPTRAGTARIFPCHGSFHPVVEVYTGGTLGSLIPIGAPVGVPVEAEPFEAGSFEAGLVGRICSLGGLGGVGFDAVAGQAYSISVDGAGGEWGWFDLMFLEAPAPRFTRPPETLIRPKIRIRRRTAKILFTARYGVDARYRCKLDRRRFRPCWSPKTYERLRTGRHRFAVFAIDESGNRDPTPAVRHFRIRKR